MNNYQIRTKRVAYFLYNVNAENEEQAKAAAIAMMDSEEYTGHDIDYEHEVDECHQTDHLVDPFPNDYGIVAGKVLDLYEDGIDGSNCEAVQRYVDSKVKGETE